MLHDFGLKESRVDPSIFLSKQGAIEVHLFIYVDDIIIASANENEIQRYLTMMGHEFPIRSPIFPSYTSLHSSQTQYLVNLLHSSDMDNLKSTVTPIVANLDLHPQGSPIPNAKEYRRIVGSLQYVTLTRPDVQLAVNRLSQFMACLEEIHWTTMMRVLRFLSGTTTHGIILRQMVGKGITA